MARPKPAHCPRVAGACAETGGTGRRKRKNMIFKWTIIFSIYSRNEDEEEDDL